MTFLAMDQTFVDHIRAGGANANGQPAERAISKGTGTPCRSCLSNVPEGEEMLICAARPFATLHPYAETGPIFLCARPCKPWAGAGLPPILHESPDYLIKAYGSDERIRYGTGEVLGRDVLAHAVAQRLADPDNVFVDVRSARNNCFLTRMRGPGQNLPVIR
ncbi:DUF1203 domain-containing protein [Jannaschia pohangensis]|uniref:DUF1203 domain-containing protein n=1 Tax=Jannaschia pohangensis TaxID=390807 RepID=A0A1I3IEM1_9RHOB|nr:DUF1203 domain-containing protein [Jannaschia pohangensis]SFI46309.1 Protein of unknown function [Jannaschia pohangensis]